MKLSVLFALPSALLSTVYAAATSYSPPSDSYREQLNLKPLPGGSLYAGFSFTATTPLSSYNKQHYRYFPRALAQILQYTHTSELHLRFSLGRWDEESWGSRPRAGLREGGNGVELWAWIEKSGERNAEERWSDLVNSLSGLFCASLNFIDSGKTVRPLLTFEPEGTLSLLYSGQSQNKTFQRDGSLELLHGMLPHEVVCTENLTPFLKLLPCKGKAGIASLLDGHKVFDANWQTMSVDVRPVCRPSFGSEDCELEIQQTVDIVLDIERAKRPRGDPIPRPLSIEEVACDESKSYHADDTCYPAGHKGELEWSLNEVFGRKIKGSCPLSTGRNKFEIRLDIPSARTAEVISEDPAVIVGLDAVRFTTEDGQESRLYRIPEHADFDLHLPQQILATASSQPSVNVNHSPSIRADRHLAGFGQERGSMHTTLYNPHPYPQTLIYLETLPWFLRPYMHTLSLSGSGSIEKMYYTPLLDRQRGTHLELMIKIEAETSIQLTYDVEKAILRYTEYPPDANRGFDIPAAIIRVLPSDASHSAGDAKAQGSYLRTTSLLLPLPTPDFSMPYNVIILTSTVIALGFGSVFNLLVRRFVLADEVPVSPLFAIVKQGVERVKAIIRDLRKNGAAADEAEVDGMKAARANGDTNGKPKERKRD